MPVNLKSVKHSKRFLGILREASPYKAIRSITHSKPLLVFWVSPEGKVLDARDSHHDNPPDKDRSVLSHKSHKGHLRGRAAFIGDVIYIAIYGEGQIELNQKQKLLLGRSYQAILRKIKDKNIELSQSILDSSVFINEIGDVIAIPISRKHET